MKPDARQTAQLLKSPGGLRAVLLYGDDEGLIRERAEQLTRAAAGSLDDPFRVAELDRADWPRIPDEMAALSMMGGRRVVRLRDVTDTVTEPIRAALKGPGEALLVVEAPGLGKGKLRTLLETAPDGAAIGCYPEEGRALSETIRAMLAEHGAGIDPDALTWLTDTIGGDRSVVRGEIEKLALLAGPGARISIDLARLSVGDGAGASADDALLAATSGDTETADSAVETAVAEGVNGVALIRMAISHLQKLHQARLRMSDGASAQEALRTLRPPVFFRALPAMTKSLTRWPEPALLRALEEARAVELACKQTGTRGELLAKRFIVGLSRRGAAGS